MDDTLITAHEAAKLIDVAPSTIIKHIKLGTIKAIQKDRIVPTYYVRSEELIRIREFYLSTEKKRGRKPKWILAKTSGK